MGVNDVSLSLVVLRSPDLSRAAMFYERLGLKFSRHRHGKGPEHLSAELGAAVFEIYPAAGGESTLGTRVGFRVSSVDTILAALADNAAAVVSPAKDSEWGRRAVICDPDGHRIELLES
jgi:predicted enzyme related to lactoylglutathione lyase